MQIKDFKISMHKPSNWANCIIFMNFCKPIITAKISIAARICLWSNDLKTHLADTDDVRRWTISISRNELMDTIKWTLPNARSQSVLFAIIHCHLNGLRRSLWSLPLFKERIMDKPLFILLSAHDVSSAGLLNTSRDSCVKDWGLDINNWCQFLKWRND